MENIKFSIIVPIYNIEEYVGKCIHSLLNQTYKNFEIIAVNDSSTDNSLRVLENINDKRIKIFSKINGGLSSARNYGISKSTGDYIWFLDGDDYLEIKSLETLKKIIDNNYPDIICFPFYNDYANKKRAVIDRIEWGNEELYPLITVSACTKIYKLSFFLENKFKFKEGILFEDLELIPDIMTSTKNIKFSNEILYNYVQRKGSIIRSSNIFMQNRDDRFTALQSLYNRFKSKNKYYKYKEQLDYLAIRHLVNIYSEELFKYGKEIYLEKFKKINSYLNTLENVDDNKYLLLSPKSGQIYFKLFRKKKYVICKIIIKIKQILKK